MSFFLDTKETSQRFGDSISEFCSLLDAHHIRHGSPDNIFEFAKILESNNQFRIDLSAMVKSVAEKENEEILLTDMMSILIAAVGGPSFADTPADLTKPTNTLMEFLLGTGCWRRFGLSSSPKNTGTPSRPSVRAEEPRLPRFASPASEIPIVSENLEDRAGLLDASSELRQMLARIESNTQQVKRHLDSIEQRINKIESPPDIPTTPAKISSPPAPVLHPNPIEIAPEEIAHAPSEESLLFEPELPTRNRAVFSPHPQQPEAYDFPSPTFAYASEKERSILPIGVFLVLLAIIAASFFFARSEQGRGLLKAGMARFKNVHALFSSVPAAPSPAPTTTAPPPSVAPKATLPSSATPPPPTQSTIEPTPTPPASSNGIAPGPSPDAQSMPSNPGLRYIPANVMEGHLLSAPRPAYPPLARTNHIQGSVALQATISKTGSIETLHVIKGPQALRSAAVDAVRNWRYRPYSVNGRPAEIATTVNVDFTLKPPPPVIAH
jgi:TonB family protein